MKCICCLNESEDKKIFTALTASDRKNYQEFTKFEIETKSLKICKICKDSLKSSLNFLRICLKSHQQLKENDENEKKLETRRARKRKFKEDSDVDDPPELEPEHLQQDSNDEDEIPISEIQQQLQKEIEINLEEPTIKDESTDEIKTPNTRKSTPKFLCTECGVSFQTFQRLQIHSFTHSGVKSFLCEYDSCGKSFATSKLSIEDWLFFTKFSFHFKVFD